MTTEDLDLQALDSEALALLDELDGAAGPTHFARDGSPMKFSEYLIASRDINLRIVAQDYFDGGGILVSTVWLGIDMSWPAKPPRIFETMVFGGARSGYSRRTSKEWEALWEHSEAVKLVVDALDRTTQTKRRRIRRARNVVYRHRRASRRTRWLAHVGFPMQLSDNEVLEQAAHIRSGRYMARHR